MKNLKPLTVLHTSDWHLGRRLYGRMRYDEFAAFLGWLETAISEQHVDVLIVAGDIFDTMTPSNRAQALYYEFLGRVSRSCCQHIVIVAGNHDSPTFLDAPSHVLKFLNVHVIGTACEDLNDEVLVLDDTDGAPHCIIAAVPYLRDRDVRSSSAGESMDSKDANVIKGIRAHYDNVASIAKAKQSQLIKSHQRHIPIIATGHLFAAGGTTTEDDGVRELYVGSLGKVSADMFDDGFDYVALGHLHVPQRVGGRETIRYSGSPIAMGFGEARQQKQVLIIKFAHEAPSHSPISAQHSAAPSSVSQPLAYSKDKPTASTKPEKSPSQPVMDDLFAFVEIEVSNVAATDTPSDLSDKAAMDIDVLHVDDAKSMQIASLRIPYFQKLAQISGDLTTIAKAIQALDPAESVWLEVVYDGDEIVHELREEIGAMIEGLPCDVLKIKNTRTYNKVLNQEQTLTDLQDLNEMEVFEHCLDVHAVAQSQKPSLRDAYQQILHDIYHHDSAAE